MINFSEKSPLFNKTNKQLRKCSAVLGGSLSDYPAVPRSGKVKKQKKTEIAPKVLGCLGIRSLLESALKQDSVHLLGVNSN